MPESSSTLKRSLVKVLLSLKNKAVEEILRTLMGLLL